MVLSFSVFVLPETYAERGTEGLRAAVSATGRAGAEDQMRSVCWASSLGAVFVAMGSVFNHQSLMVKARTSIFPDRRARKSQRLILNALVALLRAFQHVMGESDASSDLPADELSTPHLRPHDPEYHCADVNLNPIRAIKRQPPGRARPLRADITEWPREHCFICPLRVHRTRGHVDTEQRVRVIW